MRLELTFPNKIIVCGLNDNTIIPFLEGLLKYVWITHDIPEASRNINQGKKLTLDMLPKNFDISTVAKDAFKKGIVMFDRIGVVNVWLKAFIVRTQGTKPEIKVEIDKFSYEKDGDCLQSVLNRIKEEMDS